MTQTEFKTRLNELKTFQDLYNLIHQANLAPAVIKHLTALKAKEAAHVQSRNVHQPGTDLAMVPQVRRGEKTRQPGMDPALQPIARDHR